VPQQEPLNHPLLHRRAPVLHKPSLREGGSDDGNKPRLALPLLVLQKPLNHPLLLLLLHKTRQQEPLKGPAGAGSDVAPVLHNPRLEVSVVVLVGTTRPAL
jgi:hypothetical protein